MADGGQDRRGPAGAGTGIPVVPIAHWGAQRILPYGKFVPKFLPRKTVQVVAGPPVDLSEFAGQPLTQRGAAGRPPTRS